MPPKTLVLEFFDTSAPLRRAVTDEVIIRCFDGVGPIGPDIIRITVEYADPRVKDENPVVVAEPEASYHYHHGPRNDDWAV